MNKNRITLLGVGLLTLACSVMVAQDSKIGPQQAITKGSNIIHPVNLAPPPANIVLFSNLGSSGDAYDDTNGWLIEGVNNTVSFTQQSIGNPWTPTADSTLKQAKVALQYDGSGVNQAVLALYSDASGVPGTPLVSVNVKNMPVFGTCCTLVTVGNAKGIKVKKGVTYWVVATVNAASSTFYGVWDYTWNDSQGPIAFESTGTGDVWTPFTGTTNAFALYGTTP